MATITMGTSATTSLNPALKFLPGYGSGMAAADIAAMALAILDDLNVAHPVYPNAFSSNGLLFVPNRGVLKMLPGDYVGIDSEGWPILVSANSIANAAWTKSA
jgi:hypothetical protein